MAASAINEIFKISKHTTYEPTRSGNLIGSPLAAIRTESICWKAYVMNITSLSYNFLNVSSIILSIRKIYKKFTTGVHKRYLFWSLRRHRGFDKRIFGNNFFHFNDFTNKKAIPKLQLQCVL